VRVCVCDMGLLVW